MYEKLIQALRCCADDNIPCAKCPRQAKCVEERSMNGLFPEAADAIEELSRQLAEYKKFDGFLMVHGMFGESVYVPNEPP